MSGILGSRGPMTSSADAIKAQMQENVLEAAQSNLAETVAEKREIQADQSDFVNPLAARFNKVSKDIKARGRTVQKMLRSTEKGQRMIPVEFIKNTADHFQRRNPELKADILLALRELIKPGDSKETILAKLKQFFPDVSLADEALDFLLETTTGQVALDIQEVKNDLNQERGREIKAGRNIGAEARAAAEKGIGTPTSLRDMYRDITGNPRDSTTLFQELSNKYAYKDLKKIIDFMLHSLGADLKSGGPSIAPGLLHRLISETRNMQAILGVYRFFRNRMRLVEKSFGEQNIPMPKELSFESMAKVFMGLAEDRYPTASKVHQTTSQLGITNAPLAKSVVYSQMRDGVREVARDLVFTTVQHRDELWNAIVEFLMDVEDQLESEPNEVDNQIDKLISGSDEGIRPKGDNDEVVT